MIFLIFLGESNKKNIEKKKSSTIKSYKEKESSLALTENGDNENIGRSNINMHLIKNRNFSLFCMNSLKILKFSNILIN